MNDPKDLFLIFDLDGTLWDASVQLAESWNLAIQSMTLTPAPPVVTAESLLGILGSTMDEIAEVILPGLDDATRRAAFKRCEEVENAYMSEHGGILYPDVEKTLEILREQNYQMAVVSNCQAGYISAFYTSTGLGRYFCDQEEWGATGLSKAENIRLVMKRNGFEKAVYIGDTIKDYTAACGAGVPFIHAAFGFGEVPEAAHRIYEFAELPYIVSSLPTSSSPR